MKLFTTVLMAGQAAAEIFECKHPQSTTWDDGNVLGQITGLETDPLTCADYLDKNYCRTDGRSGNGFAPGPDIYWPDYSHNGMHPGNCFECGCQFTIQISMVPAAVQADPTPTVVTPCPSSECWTYDEKAHKCSMKSECATLACGATDMDISFQKELFNLDGDEATFAGSVTPSSDGQSDWAFKAPLGTAGMTYTLDAEKNEITFALNVAVVGDDMRTRTDDVQDNVISLGTQSVVTTPFGAAVSFSCTYPLSIEVASQGYTVEGASVVDNFFGTGSLAAGFAMSLNGDEGTSFMLGNNLSVAVSWSVTAVQALTFYINQCTVEHGTTIIPIVKDGCYSGALNVAQDDNLQGFNFPIFKGSGETDPVQTIKCTVNLCESGKCADPQYTKDCPGTGPDATGDDVYYKFSVVGSGP